jgi:hypothetical protein
MDRLLLSHPLVPGSVGGFLVWCDELRARRPELERSRQRVGLTRQVMWVHPDAELAVVCLEAEDPLAAYLRLGDSADPFDQWYRRRELYLHGAPLLAEDRPPSVALTEYRNGEPGPLDMFIAAAFPIMAGKTDLLTSAVRASTEGGGGLERVRRWGLKRLTIWLQTTPTGDVVIYESVGEIPEMVRSLTSDTDPLIEEQRRIIDEVFGLDLATSSFPVPLPAFSWSIDGPG